MSDSVPYNYNGGYGYGGGGAPFSTISNKELLRRIQGLEAKVTICVRNQSLLFEQFGDCKATKGAVDKCLAQLSTRIDRMIKRGATGTKTGTKQLCSRPCQHGVPASAPTSLPTGWSTDQRQPPPPPPDLVPPPPPPPPTLHFPSSIPDFPELTLAQAAEVIGISGAWEWEAEEFEFVAVAPQPETVTVITEPTRPYTVEVEALSDLDSTPPQESVPDPTPAPASAPTACAATSASASASTAAQKALPNPLRTRNRKSQGKGRRKYSNCTANCCPRCGRRFCTTAYLRRHIHTVRDCATKTKPRLYCQFRSCSASFIKLETLKAHQRRVHVHAHGHGRGEGQGPQSPQEHRALCSGNGSVRYYSRKPMRPRLPCAICGKTNYSREALNTHLRRVHGYGYGHGYSRSHGHYDNDINNHDKRIGTHARHSNGNGSGTHTHRHRNPVPAPEPQSQPQPQLQDTVEDVLSRNMSLDGPLSVSHSWH